MCWSSLQVKKEREAFIKQGMDDSALAIREVEIILPTFFSICQPFQLVGR